MLKIERSIFTDSGFWLMDFLLPKMSSSVAGKTKFQYKEIQTLAYEKQYYNKFSEFNYETDVLDVFLGK